jgi:hypothetical protein
LTSYLKKLDWNFMTQLGWVALYAALAVAAMLGTELVITKLLAANPDKPQQEALASLVSLAMLLGLVAAVSAALVFLPAQLLQTLALRFGVAWSLSTIPVGALMSWYCFDRILPLDVNLGFDGLPARSGPQELDWPSYLTALAFQAAVSGIGLSRYLKRGRGALLLALGGAALVFGVIWGHAMAELHPAA